VLIPSVLYYHQNGLATERGVGEARYLELVIGT
jgi:hypothetical protein